MLTQIGPNVSQEQFFCGHEARGSSLQLEALPEEACSARNAGRLVSDLGVACSLLFPNQPKILSFVRWCREAAKKMDDCVRERSCPWVCTDMRLTKWRSPKNQTLVKYGSYDAAFGVVFCESVRCLL